MGGFLVLVLFFWCYFTWRVWPVMIGVPALIVVGLVIWSKSDTGPPQNTQAQYQRCISHPFPSYAAGWGSPVGFQSSEDEFGLNCSLSFHGLHALDHTSTQAPGAYWSGD